MHAMITSCTHAAWTVPSACTLHTQRMEHGQVIQENLGIES
jgi:hypothetical protein